jgi:hypothetical protein
MKQKTIKTDRGETSYYTMTGNYEGMLSFHVKFEKELQECEFALPLNKIPEEQHDFMVMLFARGYEQGRQRGRWEKSKKLGELFHALKCEALGA